MSGQTTAGTGHHTTGHSTSTQGHPKCNQDHEHTMACGMGMHEHVSAPSQNLAEHSKGQSPLITPVIMMLCVPKHKNLAAKCPLMPAMSVPILQGKQDAWGHAHSKTHEASKHANASELAACKAQEHYGNLTESQKNAENARRRHQEVCTILSCIMHVSFMAVLTQSGPWHLLHIPDVHAYTNALLLALWSSPWQAFDNILEFMYPGCGHVC